MKEREDIAVELNYYISNELSTDGLVGLNNRWNDETSDGNYIYGMSDFDDVYRGESPSDIADAVTSGEYDSCDDYFVHEGSECHTFCDPSDWIDTDELTDYMIDNDEDFGDSRIREILDSADEDDDTIILIHPTYGEDIAIGKEEFRNEHDNEADMFFTESNEVMTGHEIVEWLDEHGGDELVITEFTLEKYLRRNGFTTEMCVCMHDGIVFGDDSCFDDGRFYQWFYCHANGLLLKLYFASPSCSDLVLYIKEIKGNESQMDMYRLIQRYVH